MTRTEHLLWVLAEECAEVAQRASKAARFSLDEVQPGQELTNEARLWQEMSDLVAVGEMLISLRGQGGLSRASIDAKKAKVEKFLMYARSPASLEPAGLDGVAEAVEDGHCATRGLVQCGKFHTPPSMTDQVVGVVQPEDFPPSVLSRHTAGRREPRRRVRIRRRACLARRGGAWRGRQIHRVSHHDYGIQVQAAIEALRQETGTVSPAQIVRAARDA